MNCSRKSCEGIMCDTYVGDIGYVCYDCQREFKEYLSKENIPVTTEGEIRRALTDFMQTNKDNYKNDGAKISVDEFFNQHSR